MAGRVARLHQVRGGCVDVSFMVLGFIANNVYVIEDGDGVIIVDPSCRPIDIMGAVEGRKVNAIFCTHNHVDHVGCVAKIKELTGAPVYASTIDAPLIEEGQWDRNSNLTAEPCKVDHRVKEGDEITVGKTTWKVIATPGHTKGSICFFLDPKDSPSGKGAPVLVSGDTLFAGSIGRTDFAGGSMSEMRKSLARLSKLPNATIVLPGHNGLTTIAAEQRRVFAYFL